MSDIETIGEATGTAAKANELTLDLRGRIEAVAGNAPPGSRAKKVACIEWLDPLIVAGHWMPEMVQMAGGVDALAEPGAPSRRVSFDELAGSDPDVLILMPCGMGVDKAAQELSSLDELGRWKSLRAVKQGDVFAVDAGSLFSRSGPRLVDGLELLARLIRPDAFPGSVPDDVARRLTALPG